MQPLKIGLIRTEKTASILKWCKIIQTTFVSLQSPLFPVSLSTHRAHISNSYKLQLFCWTMEPLWWFVHLNQSYLPISKPTSQSQPRTLTVSPDTAPKGSPSLVWLTWTAFELIEMCRNTIRTFCIRSVDSLLCVSGTLDLRCDWQFGLPDMNSECVQNIVVVGWECNKSGSQWNSLRDTSSCMSGISRKTKMKLQIFVTQWLHTDHLGSVLTWSSCEWSKKKSVLHAQTQSLFGLNEQIQQMDPNQTFKSTLSLL